MTSPRPARPVELPRGWARLRMEFARKAIHLATGLVPLGYAFCADRRLALIVLGLLTVGMILIEFLRRGRHPLGRWFARRFGFMLRAHEQNRLLGATHYCVASLLCVALFPRPIAVLALLYLAIGDTAASLVGIAWGRIKIGRKSLEGTLAFWLATSLVALLAASLSREYPLVAALVASPCAALAELLLPMLDDNWVIPLVSAGVMLAALSIFPA